MFFRCCFGAKAKSKQRKVANVELDDTISTKATSTQLEASTQTREHSETVESLASSEERSYKKTGGPAAALSDTPKPNFDVSTPRSETHATTTSQTVSQEEANAGDTQIEDVGSQEKASNLETVAGLESTAHVDVTNTSTNNTSVTFIEPERPSSPTSLRIRNPHKPRMSLEVKEARRKLARERSSVLMEELKKIEMRTSILIQKEEHAVEELDTHELDLLNDVKQLEEFDPEEFNTDGECEDEVPPSKLDPEEEIELNELGRELEDIAQNIGVDAEEDLDNIINQ